LNKQTAYQVAIVGGGVAGLTLSIQLADAGISCVVFEKNSYPFHKVCGEYISMESWGFLERIGLGLEQLNLPKIKRLTVSSPSGNLLHHNLDLGGFGISRFLLDSKLAEIAGQKGVCIMDGCKVNNIEFQNDRFIIGTTEDDYTALFCIGAWGKQSNLDNKLSRSFLTKINKNKNYAGIKYHVTIDFPDDLIELHNFKNGYCGISKIEENKYCLCYLTDADNLKDYKGNIKEMEEAVLMKNPFLKKYFTEANFLFDKPIAISQIKIGYKRAVENNILMLGDTAGNIAPLSGNGMSIAMRSSFFLNRLLVSYFKNQISRHQLEKEYIRFWNANFRKRIFISAYLQRLLKNEFMTNVVIGLFKKLPSIKSQVIKTTYGPPF
jgi:flavin-dependent dehydrogenase